MSRFLSLDLSTTATGWALWNSDNKELLEFGVIKPQVKGLKGKTYPKGSLQKMRSISVQVVQLISSQDNLIAVGIEEINNKSRRTGRLSQKVLDALHFILLDRMGDTIDKVVFKDSGGGKGWRDNLQLRLSEVDKKINLENRKWNKRIPKGHKKRPIITDKHLACRFVNKHYGLKLDCDERKTDADIADAIAVGHALLHFDMRESQNGK